MLKSKFSDSSQRVSALGRKAVKVVEAETGWLLNGQSVGENDAA